MANLFWTYLNLVCTVLVLTPVFFAVEQLFPAQKNHRPAKLLFNTIYYLFIVIWVLGLQFVFAPMFSFALSSAGGGLLPKLFNSPTTFWGQVLFALAFALVWDLWQYWIHRFQHRWPVLWETHKFHHSETDLNSSAQARHHLSNYILFTVLYLPLLLVFGSLTPHFVATFLMFRIWGFVNHTNTRIDFGGVTPIIAGPQWHRIHHSLYPEHYDKNFAAFFPFIDLIFGTYYRPEKGEYPPTGLPAEADSGSWRQATVAPFVGWYKMLTRVRSSSADPDVATQFARTGSELTSRGD
jgi:sterol desaturase/sphingolipid hydroxylase (fatty acid hydroxylase superfamily)